MNFTVISKNSYAYEKVQHNSCVGLDKNLKKFSIKRKNLTSKKYYWFYCVTFDNNNLIKKL